MADLQTVTAVLVGELDMAVEGGDVHLVQLGRDLVGVQGAGFFHRVLQDQARGVTPGGVIARVDMEALLIVLGELRPRWGRSPA